MRALGSLVSSLNYFIPSDAQIPGVGIMGRPKGDYMPRDSSSQNGKNQNWIYAGCIEYASYKQSCYGIQTINFTTIVTRTAPREERWCCLTKHQKRRPHVSSMCFVISAPALPNNVARVERKAVEKGLPSSQEDETGFERGKRGKGREKIPMCYKGRLPPASNNGGASGLVMSAQSHSKVMGICHRSCGRNGC